MCLFTLCMRVFMPVSTKITLIHTVDNRYIIYLIKYHNPTYRNTMLGKEVFLLTQIIKLL